MLSIKLDLDTVGNVEMNTEWSSVEAQTRSHCHRRLYTLPFFMFCNRQDAWRLSSFSYYQNCIKSREDQGHFTEKRCIDIIRTGVRHGPTCIPKFWINVFPLILGRKCSPYPLFSFFPLSNSPLFLKNGLYYSSVILVVKLLGEERCYK